MSIRETAVADSIRRVALENDSEAIVVGIEGRGRLGEVLLGRTSRDIIRRAALPGRRRADGPAHNQR